MTFARKVEITTPSRYLGPVGRCIYCLRKSYALGKEHIIPFGLAGDSLVLRSASCNRCGRETKAYETIVLRHMWWPFRTKAGMRTRNKAEVPKFFRMQRTSIGGVVDGRVEHTPSLVENVDAQDYPLFFYSFVFPPPAMLDGRARTHDKVDAFFLIDKDTITPRLGHQQGMRIGPDAWIAFCKMLGKIAHAYGVALLGLDGFRHDLTLALRNKADVRLLNWIGSLPLEPAAPLTLHEIELRTCNVGHRIYAAVRVRLFAAIGAPTYEVLLGELAPGVAENPTLKAGVYRIALRHPLPFANLTRPVDASGMTKQEIETFVDAETPTGAASEIAARTAKDRG